MQNDKQKWFLLISLSLIWGSSFILIKKGLIGLTPIQVGALRIFITAIVLLIVGFKSLFNIKKEHLWPIVLTAIFGTFIPVFLFSFAISKIDSSMASILNSLTPLNTLILGFLFFGFTFKRFQIIGVLVGLIGTIFLIILGEKENNTLNFIYILLPVISSISYALNVNILKKYLSHLNALSIATGNFVVLIIPAFIILWNTNLFAVKPSENTTISILYIAILSVFGTALAKTLFNKLVQISSPAFSTSVTYLIPLIAIFWGLVDGEKISFLQYISALLILVGVYLSSSRKRNKI